MIKGTGKQKADISATHKMFIFSDSTLAMAFFSCELLNDFISSDL